MRDLAERLKQQNNGHAWLDCNAVDHGHRWELQQIIHRSEVDRAYYWRCQRCPVITLRVNDEGERPPRVLNAP